MFIKDIIIMKIINSLKTAFIIYIIILNENTQNNKNMFKIDNFFKKLENKECQMKQSNISITNTVNQIQNCEDYKDCKDYKDYEDYKDCDDYNNKRDKSTISKSSTSCYTSYDNNYNNNIEYLYKY